MTAKEFIIECYERHATAVENGYDIRVDEKELLEIMEEYAAYKLDLSRKNSGNFTNGSFSLSWVDVDTVKVFNHRAGKYALILGGDIEGVFSALTNTVSHKENKRVLF